jgi:hypothetical protein
MTQDRTAVRNIVLVHGGFVDGSGWERLYKILSLHDRSIVDRVGSTQVMVSRKDC